MFQEMLDYGHEKIVWCSEPDAGLKAIIAIHSTVLGPAVGGCRIRPYRRDQDALFDVMRLSRGMTLKTAAAKLGVGGGKSVIIADPATEKTPALLTAFARCVESLGGMYYTSEDSGMTVPDLNLIGRHTRYAIGGDESPHALGDPSMATAYGAYLGIRAGVEIRLGRKDLAGVRVAVQGVGNVGACLTELLCGDGAQVTVCDIVPERAAAVANKYGVASVDPQAIYDVDCDVFSPAGFGGSINRDTIPRLRARVVAGAANNQLLDEQADAELLARREIYFVPDFIVSCGGVILGTSEIRRIPYEEAFQAINIVTPNVFEVDTFAREQGITTTEAAVRMAWGRVEEAKRQSTAVGGGQQGA